MAGPTNHRLRESAMQVQVQAQDVQAGDFLDAARKVRVHTVLTRNGRTTLAYRVRGSGAPGATGRCATETVEVYR
jgi:hypothetical protein